MRVKFLLSGLVLVAVPCSAAPAGKKGPTRPVQGGFKERRVAQASMIASQRFLADYKIDIYRATGPQFGTIYDEDPKFYRVTYLPYANSAQQVVRKGRLGYGFGVSYFVSKSDMKIHKIMHSGQPSDPISKKTAVVTQWK